MARTNKGNKRKQMQAAKQPTSESQILSRRNIFQWMAGGVLSVGVLGAGGAWAVNSFNRSVDERDLSRIGQGQPSIVQIHDPQCPVCNALQRETRKALKQLAGKQLAVEPPIYLIADITQTEGAVFAQQHRVQHVTLLLFDAQGQRVQTLTGSRTRAELEPIFVKHAQ